MSVFLLQDYLHLITWIVFIFWEPYSMKEKDTKDYDTYYEKRPHLIHVPRWVFPPVWFFLKSTQVVAYFLYLKYVSENDALFASVYIVPIMSLIIAGVCLSKYWTAFYFRWKMYSTAGAVAFVLMGCAVVVTVLMGISGANGQFGSLWAIPFVFSMPLTLWLVFAFVLNAQRVREEMVLSELYTRVTNRKRGTMKSYIEL